MDAAEKTFLPVYRPSAEWRRFRKPSHSSGHEVMFGFVLRFAVAILSVIISAVPLLIIGALNGWDLTNGLLIFFAASIGVIVFLGEHLRSLAYERHVAIQKRPIELDEELRGEQGKAGANVEKPFGLSPRQKFEKRAFDIAFAAPALVLFLPLFAIIAVAIKLDTPGPVSVRIPYYGLGGRRFMGYQFRTTRVGENGPTVIGDLLVRSSLDRLPLLINVVLGDMSLVGPRRGDRSDIRPGLTGLYQLKRNERGSANGPQEIEADRQYVNEWSLDLDLKIVLVTILTLLLKNTDI